MRSKEIQGLGELNYVSQKPTGWTYNTHHACVPALKTSRCFHVCKSAEGDAGSLPSGSDGSYRVRILSRGYSRLHSLRQKDANRRPVGPTSHVTSPGHVTPSRAAYVCYRDNCWAPSRPPGKARNSEAKVVRRGHCSPGAESVLRAFVSGPSPPPPGLRLQVRLCLPAATGTRASGSRDPCRVGTQWVGSASDREFEAKTVTARTWNGRETQMRVRRRSSAGWAAWWGALSAPSPLPASERGSC